MQWLFEPEKMSVSDLDNSILKNLMGTGRHKSKNYSHLLAGLIHGAKDHDAKVEEKSCLVCGQQYPGLQRILCFP